jgi:hypothetical protein
LTTTLPFARPASTEATASLIDLYASVDTVAAFDRYWPAIAEDLACALRV